MNIIEKDRKRYREFFGKRDAQKDYWVHTICSGCYGECAVRVRVLDGKPVAVEGVPESDRGARGGICAKGVTSLMDLYSPDRILYPLKRTNPRKGLHEDPGWQRISWEEAMDIVVEKLKDVRQKDPREAFFGMTPGPTGGTRATINFLRLMTACGGTHVSGGPSVMCGASAHHVGALHYAAWDIIPDYDYCNYVLRCGGNEGWGGGRNGSATIRQGAQARERGMKMKVMDPQGFTVASKGEEWIPILPATDIAVFLVIANLIVNEIGVYDVDYIRHKTNGPYLTGPDRLFVRDSRENKPLLFDEADGKVKAYDDPSLTRPALDGKYTVEGVECQPVFALIKEHLKQYKPEWASEVSTVPANTIRRLARELVEEAKIGSTIKIKGVEVPYRPACVVGYKGLQTHQNSHHQYSAMHFINALLGNQDVCGGILGSGTARSLGYPETGGFTFSPYGGFEGMLTCGAWVIGWSVWPPRKSGGPGTKMNFMDVLTHSGSNIYPLGEDWEELWRNAGGTFFPKFYMVYGANIVMNMVRPEAAEKFLKKIPFMAAFQPFHNETTEGFCDIVLPESHYLETLDLAASFGVTYNYPIGMDKWSFHVRMPVVEPKGETRNLMDVMHDLADRVGVRDEYNKQLDELYTFRNARQAGKNIEIPHILGPGDRPANIEFMDKALKYHFGAERGLEWFRDNDFMTWDKKPEEAYWRWFVNARIPLYYETIEADCEETIRKSEKIGFRFDREYFTGMTTYQPSVIYTEVPSGSEYDLFVISQRDSLMTYRFSAQNPFINDAASRNPYTYNVVLNSKTGKKKGIKEGDRVTLENRWGDKVTGTVKLSELVHPQVLAAVGLGGWAKGRPIAMGKGINPNALLRQDQKRFDPLSGASEPAVRVKVYKEERVG
ncbi:MAG: molybdopterin-dependent oxidoreductase [Syntrophales bacterium]|jgi:molybdopterin-containing oxidoreductase family molybdopterin binding subunit|nr:molybdopterin-dependent oxidoreductase [Syntrophales bacterium]